MLPQELRFALFLSCSTRRDFLGIRMRMRIHHLHPSDPVRLRPGSHLRVLHDHLRRRKVRHRWTERAVVDRTLSLSGSRIRMLSRVLKRQVLQPVDRYL